jgi:hypothetical protein
MEMTTNDDIMVDWVIFEYLISAMGEDRNTPLWKFLDIVELMTVRGYGALLTVKRQPDGKPRKINFGSVKVPHGLTDKQRKLFVEWIAETAEERRSYLTEGDVKINDLLAEVRSYLN